MARKLLDFKKELNSDKNISAIYLNSTSLSANATKQSHKKMYIYIQRNPISFRVFLEIETIYLFLNLTLSRQVISSFDNCLPTQIHIYEKNAIHSYRGLVLVCTQTVGIKNYAFENTKFG